MVAQFKDSPALWEEFYRDQNTQRLDELGFPALSSTKIVLRDQPKELQDLQVKIDACRKNLKNNGDMYATTGLDDIYYVSRTGTLIVRAFKTDYASLLMKLKKEGATSEEAEFLDNKMMFLGSSGFVRYDIHGLETYLACQVAKKNIKEGMWESVPQGLVSYGFHKEDDPFRKTLEKECREETNLSIPDFNLVRPWGVNMGSRAGNFTVIYEMHLGRMGDFRISSEHKDFKLSNKSEILAPAEQYKWNPITIRLFEKVR